MTQPNPKRQSARYSRPKRVVVRPEATPKIRKKMSANSMGWLIAFIILIIVVLVLSIKSALSR